MAQFEIAQMDAPSDAPRHRVCRFAAFAFDVRSRELRKAGALIRLPDQASRILSKLLANPGEVVTREELIAVLWPEGTHVDFDTGLNAAVKKLRRALDDSGESPHYVETLPRRGYRLIVPVTVAATSPTFASTETSEPSDNAVQPAPRNTRTKAAILAGGVVVALTGILLSVWQVRFGQPVQGSGRASSNGEANAYFAKAELLAGNGVHDAVRARALTDRALRLDPSFGKARVEYGFFGFVAVLAGYTNQPTAIYDAEREIQQGLRDDPTFSHGRAALAALLLFHGKKAESRRQAEMALRMNASDLDARHWLAVNSWLSGQSETARALELENIARGPRFFPAHETLGELARERGDWATSIREHEQVLEYDSQNGFILQALARTYMATGNLGMARTTLERLRPDDRKSFRTRAIESLLFALEGNNDRALQELDGDVLKYLELNTFDTVIAAEIYASLGAASTALEWLENAVRNGDERAEWFMRDPALARLRGLPTFQALVRSIVGRRADSVRDGEPKN